MGVHRHENRIHGIGWHWVKGGDGHVYLLKGFEKITPSSLLSKEISEKPQFNNPRNSSKK